MKYELTTQESKLMSVPEITGYEPEQCQMIAESIQEHLGYGRFIDCAWSERIVERGIQKFAVFGSVAYELPASTLSDDQAEFVCLPVIVGEKMFRIDPEVGRGGLLHICKCLKRRGQPYDGEWHCLYISSGYLYTSELELTNQQILNNIADEIDAGAAHLTGGRPGW